MATILRPMTLGELLDRGFAMYRQHFAMFVGIAAFPHLILLAAQLVNVAVLPAQAAGPFALERILFFLAITVISLAVGAASQGAVVVAVSQIHLDRPASIASSFAGIRGRLLSLALITIAVGIGVAVGFALLIVPGIIFALMWSLTIPVAVLENKGLGASTSRSAALTKGSRWRIFMLFVMYLVLFYTIIMLWEVPIFAAIGLFTRGHNPRDFPLWSQVAFPLGSFFTQCIMGPIVSIILTLIYYDQRVRKEAFDLQHMMANLDGTLGEPSTAAV